MSYNGLNNPFRPQMQGSTSEQYIGGQSHSGNSEGSSSGASFGGGGIDDGSLQRAKLKAKLGFGCAAACVLWMVTSFFDSSDLFGDGFFFTERDSGYRRDDADYEISKFVDEDALDSVVDPENDSTRSVAEANERAGFIGRMFCRGLQKPSYCR